MSNALMDADASAGLSEEQVADLKEAFAMFDINGDGTSVADLNMRMKTNGALTFV
jgi:Ca2+-binding EF-hand superfamily protein